MKTIAVATLIVGVLIGGGVIFALSGSSQPTHAQTTAHSDTDYIHMDCYTLATLANHELTYSFSSNALSSSDNGNGSAGRAIALLEIMQLKGCTT